VDKTSISFALLTFKNCASYI